jgi:hypothetical protein
MAKLVVKTMGQAGVNVDKNPLDLDDDELRQAKNAITDPSSGRSTLRKRPGLIGFNTSTLTYDVLGGNPLPAPNLGAGSGGGTITVYLGRGPL